MAMQIRNNVSWIGKIDWELRKFHGDDACAAYGTPKRRALNPASNMGESWPAS